jgi:hypothetical protein
MARNYLIGRGELLVEQVPAPGGGGDKNHPYTVEESRTRLAPLLRSTIVQFEGDEDFTPDGVHVARFLLHPAYIAKSYHPAGMLRAAGLEVIGSRERKTLVENHTIAEWEDLEFTTSELFVAGTSATFTRLAKNLEGSGALDREYDDIREFESIAAFTAADKVKVGTGDATLDQYELVLHQPTEGLTPNNQAAFLKAADRVGITVATDRAFDTGTLWFVPATGPADAITELARFSTIRVARPMPRLHVEPVTRSVQLPDLELPDAPDQLGGARVAILDGGLPEGHPLEPWLDRYWEADPSASPVDTYTEHGLAVTSAFLFGPLQNGKAAAPPPSRVSVIRILDSSTDSDNQYELYNVLGHIEEVLLSQAFDFVNISLGPSLPIEDDDVHAWTAVIDTLLGDGETLVTVAAGNNGDLDRASGNARVQVPGDAVNALTVGAADHRYGTWSRADYSAIGPGRTPGRVKPDVLAFGGSDAELFHVLGADPVSTLGMQGTSFAAPWALHQGAGIRSLLGSELSPLAIRALLMHSAVQGERPSDEVGRGKLPESLDDIIVSGDGVARIIYRGELTPGKYFRAALPLPAGGVTGMVTVTATFCFATPVDAASPDTYTRAGLEPVFRPDLALFKKGAKTPSTRTFFDKPNYQSEAKRRSDFGEWETVLHRSKRMYGTKLNSPVFDIHYNARERGGKSSATEGLPYALVLTLEAPKHVNLYQDILDTYPGILAAIEPTVEISVSNR